MDLHLWTNGNTWPDHSISPRANKFLLTTTKRGYLWWYSLWTHLIKYIKRTWEHKNIGQQLESWNKWEMTVGWTIVPTCCPKHIHSRWVLIGEIALTKLIFLRMEVQAALPTFLNKTIYVIVFWKIWFPCLISHPYGQLSWNNYIPLFLISLSLVTL